MIDYSIIFIFHRIHTRFGIIVENTLCTRCCRHEHGTGSSCSPALWDARVRCVVGNEQLRDGTGQRGRTEPCEGVASGAGEKCRYATTDRATHRRDGLAPGFHCWI